MRSEAIGCCSPHLRAERLGLRIDLPASALRDAAPCNDKCAAHYYERQDTRRRHALRVAWRGTVDPAFNVAMKAIGNTLVLRQRLHAHPDLRPARGLSQFRWGLQARPHKQDLLFTPWNFPGGASPYNRLPRCLYEMACGSDVPQRVEEPSEHQPPGPPPRAWPTAPLGGNTNAE